MLSFEDVPPLDLSKLRGEDSEVVGGFISEDNREDMKAVLFKATDYGHPYLKVRVRDGSIPHARFYILTPDDYIILYSKYWHTRCYHGSSRMSDLVREAISIEEILDLPYVYYSPTDNDIEYWVEKFRREQQKQGVGMSFPR